MTVAPRIVVTGAGGFIGSRLTAALLASPHFADARITVVDLNLAGAPTDPRLRRIEGDFAETGVLAQALAGDPDIVFHMAGMLGGAAEANYPLSRRINVEAALDLLEMLRGGATVPRLVFASSIAVFGTDLPACVDDDTLPLPTMNYGAQKRMMEIAVEQFSARGWIDGLAIRLPGIVARPDADARLKSAFLSTLFHDFAAGRDIVVPASPDGTTWLLSVPACVEAFLHAARIPTAALAARRAFTLPAQCIRIGDLVEALRRRFPHSPSQVRYEPEPEIERQFARQPPLSTPIADALGFTHDGDLSALIARAMG